jgi:hypothetical protein
VKFDQVIVSHLVEVFHGNFYYGFNVKHLFSLLNDFKVFLKKYTLKEYEAKYEKLLIQEVNLKNI